MPYDGAEYVHFAALCLVVVLAHNEATVPLGIEGSAGQYRPPGWIRGELETLAGARLTEPADTSAEAQMWRALRAASKGE